MQVREMASLRSQLDSKARPIQHYNASGGQQRLHDTTQRLNSTRERLQANEGSSKVGVCVGRVWVCWFVSVCVRNEIVLGWDVMGRSLWKVNICTCGVT